MGDQFETENHYLYVRQSIYNDLHKLLDEFKKLNTVRFEDFAKNWTERRFSFLFYGHQSEQELREFTVEAFRQAWQFMSPPIFLNQVGAVYLLYSLYIKQLCVPRVKIRLTLDDWRILEILLDKMKTQQHYDFVYIITKLKVECAFHFVFTQNQMHIRKFPQKGQGRKHNTAIQTDLLEDESIDQLSAIHEQYYQMKCGLAGKNASKPDPSLDIINMDLVQKVTKCITRYHEDCKKSSMGSRGKKNVHVTTSESEPDSMSETEQASGNARASVRSRAYSQGVKSFRSRRHRNVTVEDVDSSPEKKTSKAPVKKSQKGRKGAVSGKLKLEPQTDVDNSLMSMPLIASDEADPNNIKDIKIKSNNEGPPPAKSPKKTKKQQKKQEPRKTPKKVAKGKVKSSKK